MRSLSDVSLITDCEHKTAPTDEHTTFAYAVGTPALKHGRIDISACRPISRQTYELWTRRMEPKAGDIILSREAPVGRLGFVDGSKKVCLGQRTVLLRADEDMVLPKFLYYSLRSPNIQEWMKRRSMGSTVHHLNVGDIRNLPIGQLPSIAKQQEIVDLLQPIETLILLCLESIALQNELGDRLFHKWFHQYDFPDTFGKPYRSSGGELASTSTFGLELPSKWNLERLDNHLSFDRGFDPGSESYQNEPQGSNLVPFLRVGDLETTAEIFVDKATDGLVFCKPEDLLVTFDGSVGKVAIGLSGAISGGFRIVRPLGETISTATAYFIMRSARIQSLIQKFSTGTVLKHASNSISRLVLPYSPEQIAEFDRLTSPLFRGVQTLNTMRNHLERALSKSMSRLMGP